MNRGMKKAGLVLAALSAGACTSLPGAEPAAAASEPCPTALARNSRRIETSITGPAGRIVPIEVHLPAAPGRYPLIGFSHGALSAPDRYRQMLAPIAAAGFIVVAPMHLESEEFDHPVPPSQTAVWNSRVEDLALALEPPMEVTRLLARAGYSIDRKHVVAMGHSYGALMAQIAGGASARGPDGKETRLRAPRLVATVAWSPPGSMPGTIEAKDWAGLGLPSLVVTGTADVLTVMQKDWTWHVEGYRAMPNGRKVLWIGDGIDHYFSGSFGREKPVGDRARILFARALSQTLAFIDRAMELRSPCDPGPAIEGELVSRG